MRLISHRGNLSGPIPERENAPDYIQEAIDKGYDVEIDARLNPTGLFLGHDHPDHKIVLEWVLNRREHLWVHAKDFNSLNLLLALGVRVFYHQSERHTIIGNTRLIWSHDVSEADTGSVIPLIGEGEVASFLAEGRAEVPFHGICSDFVESLKGIRSMKK